VQVKQFDSSGHIGEKNVPYENYRSVISVPAGYSSVKLVARVFVSLIATSSQRKFDELILNSAAVYHLNFEGLLKFIAMKTN
jgi:hypothetical protein